MKMINIYVTYQHINQRLGCSNVNNLMIITEYSEIKILVRDATRSEIITVFYKSSLPCIVL